MPRKSKTTAENDSPTISFRMDDDARRVLNGRAKQLGIGRNELARSYVLQILGEAEDRSMITNAVVELKNRMDALVLDQMAGIEALLAWAGKLKEEEARKWVDENFRSPV